MKDWRPLFSVCILSSMLMAAFAVTPGIAAFITTYQVSESVATLSVTLPYLVSIPFALLAGALSTRIAKKSLCLFSCAIICLTGIAPYFFSSFIGIIIVRACMGIGLGILFTIVPSLAPDYYPKGNMRNLTIGMQSAFAGSGGFVFNILSGYLVVTNTKNIFLVYGLCIIFFIFIALLLPYKPALSATQRKVCTKKKLTCNYFVMFISLLTFLFLSAGVTLSLNISVYLSSNGIGGPIEAGYATSAYSIAAFAFGCGYILVSRVLKKHATLFACFISAIGMLLCISTNNIFVIYISASIIGAGLSIFMPSCISHIIETLPAEKTSAGIGIMMVGSSIGQTFSTYLINPAATLLSNAISARFAVSAIIFGFVALLSLLLYNGKFLKRAVTLHTSDL